MVNGDAQFEYAGSRGARLRCVTCGTTGYADGKWQERCRAGHPYKCPTCKRVFTTGQGLAAHDRNTHRADRTELYAKRAAGMRAYWARRRAERGIAEPQNGG